MAKKTPESRNAFSAEQIAFNQAYANLGARQKAEILQRVLPAVEENDFSLANLKILAGEIGVELTALEAELSGLNESQRRMKLIQFIMGQEEVDKMAEEMTIVQGNKGHLKRLFKGC